MANLQRIEKAYKAYDDAWEIRDGAVLIYRRADNKNPNYQYRLRIRGVRGYVIESSKTRDLLEAARIAEDRYDELRADVKRFGAAYISKRTWADIWNEFDREVLERKVRRKEVNPKRRTKLNGIWNNWIKPFWGNRRCADLTEPMVAEYWNWRMGQNDAPNNTLLDQSKAFTALVRFAVSKGYADANYPKLTAPVKKEKKRRGAFTLSQVRKIDKHLQEWTQSTKRSDTRFSRACFHNFVMLGFYSGMRIGEMLDLRWSNILTPDAKRQKGGSILVTMGEREIRLAAAEAATEKKAYDLTKSIVQIDIPDAITKTESRSTIPMKEAAELLERWRRLTPFRSDNDLLFPNRKGKRRSVESFEKLHRETIAILGPDYCHDRFGNPLHPYSYRHTYATVMLIHNPDVRMEDLCVNMGTSMEQMIHHYSHVRAPDLQEKLSAQIVQLAKGVRS